jgi:predicted transposase YdaD
MGKRGLTFEDVLMETGILPKWIEKGREEGKEIVARNLLNIGLSVEKTAEAAELDIEKVRSLLPSYLA